MSATGVTAAGIADPRELQAALERDVEGGVRFDAYSRHLYAQDASSYAIEPLGVCLPAARRRRRRRGRGLRATSASRSWRAAAARASPGSASRPALVLDLSRHMRAIAAIDPEARRARVQPGVVQEHLNRAAAAHGLQFGPEHVDREPGDARRHDRQQLGRQRSRSATG